MSYFLLDDYANMEPYLPGEQPEGKWIKLNANESALPPSPAVLKILNEAEYEGMGFYSDPHCHKLRQAIGEVYGFDEKNVFVGNGADEVLAFCMMSFFRKGMKIAFPDITYDFYRTYATTYNLDFTQFPLNDDFTINVDDYVDYDGDVILANPNNPTGIAISVSEIERIVKKNPERMVIIDEAYVDYGNESCIPLVRKYDNLLVVQTFSKSRNMAGARIGFAIANEDMITDMNKIKFAFNPFNMSSLAIEAGAAAARDVDYWQKCIHQVCDVRDAFEKDLKKLGFDVINTTTNFTFITHPHFSATYLFKELKKRHILVRHYDTPRINNYLRITIGSFDVMLKVLYDIKEIVGEGYESPDQ